MLIVDRKSWGKTTQCREWSTRSKVFVVFGTKYKRIVCYSSGSTVELTPLYLCISSGCVGWSITDAASDAWSHADVKDTSDGRPAVH